MGWWVLSEPGFSRIPGHFTSSPGRRQSKKGNRPGNFSVWTFRGAQNPGECSNHRVFHTLTGPGRNHSSSGTSSRKRVSPCPSYTLPVNECRRPDVIYPTCVPLKVIGRAAEMMPEAVAAAIFQHLSSAALPEPWRELLRFHQHEKGPWISYTFWVTLPDEHAERPLREAIQKLPGVVMQL